MCNFLVLSSISDEMGRLFVCAFLDYKKTKVTLELMISLITGIKVIYLFIYLLSARLTYTENKVQ